ncbi:cytochrome P450 89A2-like [Pistacia vera]|uniref:cytochrome P450 89A2-like n=1 Tax=Pistacia vera TaxID=55513 RepID=UPI0012634CDF|nr:cytochrome P450 89A2-like [Pistacia vera]
MENWFIILISIVLSPVILKFISKVLNPTNKPAINLPPGPRSFPLLGNFLLLKKPFSEIEQLLRSLTTRFGPMVTLRIGSYPAIFVADRFLAHQALIQNGSIFSDRPQALSVVDKIDSSNQHTINTASYGPILRVLRRNLTEKILHPSRVKSYSHARKWVLKILFEYLKSKAQSGDPVPVLDHFQYAMFCLLVLMCFGDKLDEKEIKKIEDAHRILLLNYERFDILNFFPFFTKIIFRKRLKEFYQLRKYQEDVLIPLIRAQKRAKEEKLNESKDVLSYFDTLLELQLPEEKRNLDEGEMVSLCSEFLNAGTDTTSTALQWIMANLVKYPDVQEKLFMEIKEIMKNREEEVKEDDLHKLPYLKAVVLEGLRRHPPAHFVLPHAVTEDAVLGGFFVPKNCSINFMVAEMGWDPKVWKDPMAFKPERFINCEESGGGSFDITGSREIKMMPFGVGRRICPGLGLAMLHLEYFVANMVWSFKWKAVDGDEVDLEEKQEFTMVMKNPLQAHLSPRFNY